MSGSFQTRPLEYKSKSPVSSFVFCTFFQQALSSCAIMPDSKTIIVGSWDNKMWVLFRRSVFHFIQAQVPLTFKKCAQFMHFVGGIGCASPWVKCIALKRRSVAVNLVSLTVTKKVVCILRVFYSCCLDDCLRCRVSHNRVSFLESSFFIAQTWRSKRLSRVLLQARVWLALKTMKTSESKTIETQFNRKSDVFGLPNGTFYRVAYFSTAGKGERRLWVWGYKI